MPLPLAPHTPTPSQAPRSGETPSNSGGSSRRPRNLLGSALGFGLLATSIWGFWVAADISRYAGTSSLGPGGARLGVAIFLLSWLVLFSPFCYFGIVLLRSSFASEQGSWLIPLRVFTYLIGKRLSIEKQRQEFFNNPPAKPLPPPGSPEYLDMPPASPATKSPSDPSKVS